LAECQKYVQAGTEVEFFFHLRAQDDSLALDAGLKQYVPGRFELLAPGRGSAGSTRSGGGPCSVRYRCTRAASA
jgi:hypothetical protein